MCSTRVLKPLIAVVAALPLLCGYSAASFAQSADQEAKLRVLQERIDALSKELKSVQDEQAKTSKTVGTAQRGSTRSSRASSAPWTCRSTKRPRE
jgi:septal ring factor EnvC (AmiA/AmiB activator)